MTPRAASTSKIGPDYNGRLSEFVTKYWDVDTASNASKSLRRAVHSLRGFPAP